jgi:DNA-binding transcriptional LysR family regulator
MELRQLRYFVAVAEEGQYLAASKKLLISQPALSQQINLLERELGIDLFIKNQRKVYRKVALTEGGKIFLKDAQHILRLCDKAKETIKSSGMNRQLLRLGTYRMLVSPRILETLKLFSAVLPDTDVKIVELPTHLSVQEALLDETIDFGISVLPLHYPQLDSIILKKSRLNVILPHHHPLATAESLTLSALQEEKWIEIDPSVHPIFDLIEKLCIKAGFNRRPHIVQEVSSLDVMVQLVSMGKGIAFVPSFYETHAVSDIVNRPLNDTAIEFEQCLVFKKDSFNDIINALHRAI